MSTSFQFTRLIAFILVTIVPGVGEGCLSQLKSKLDRCVSRLRPIPVRRSCMKQLLLCGILFSILSVLPSNVVQAANWTAASCSASDVQNAMNKAAAGDTVVIPPCPGGQSWTSGISWTAPANVTLKGAGTTATGGGDQTVIIDDYNASNTPLLSITVSSTGVFRMTGITIQGGSGNHANQGVLRFFGPGSIRLDHLHLNEITYSPAWNGKSVNIGATVYGVMDHCVINYPAQHGIFYYNGTGTAGNTTWTETAGFGSANFFFLEDNYITGDPVAHNTRISDCYTAGKFVTRFNTLVGLGGPEEHATGHAGDDRGCRAMEYYGNFHQQGGGQTVPNYDMVAIKSGSGLVWGNSAVGTYQNVAVLQFSRMNNVTYTQSAPPAGWGYCGTDFNGTRSNWDQNSNSGTGYACIDQPGRGKGDLLTGSFPNKVNSTTGTIAWPNQESEPIYFWANNASPAPGYSNWYLNASNTKSGYRVTQNADNTRPDYSATQTPSYYPQSSGIQTSKGSPFDGTKGTGWGTLANRPTTCTKGVGYWATDQGSWNHSSSNPYGVQMNGSDGVLYVCTATDTWSLYYTPYTYPHPLQSAIPSPPGTPYIVK